MRHRVFLNTAAGVMAIGSAALAQPASETEVGEVVITGSRIVRDGYEAPTPVTVATAQALKAAAPGNLADGLNQLPQFGGSIGPTRQIYTNVTGANRSGNFLALRNLGPSPSVSAGRTLTMMDGRRLPPTTFQGLVDAGSIPELLVQRVDVVTGGVSAVYGSDAVAGVVNFILDSRFTGVKAEAQAGFSNYNASGFSYIPGKPGPGKDGGKSTISDGKSYKIGGAFGAPLLDGRGHVLASFERTNQDPVRRVDRPYGTEGWAFVGKAGAGPAGAAANPFFLSRNVVQNVSTYTGKFTAGPAGIINTLVSADGRTVRPWDDGALTGVAGISIGGSGDPNPVTLAQTGGLRNDQAFGQVSYDLTEDVAGSVNATYSHSIGNIASAGAQISGIQMFNGNPFLPAAIQQVMTATNTASTPFTKRMIDTYPIDVREANSSLTLTADLKGKFADKWSFEGYYSYGRTHNNYSSMQTENSKWYAALDAVRDPATGNTVCRITLTSPTVKPGCVPYNPFGLDNASDAAKAYIESESAYEATHTTHIVNASVSGELFSTWAGPIGVSVGAEYRKLRLDLNSNSDPFEPLDYTGIRGLPATLPPRFLNTNQGEAHGGTNVKEVFGEIAVPLARDMPWAKSLEVSGAARRTDYALSGPVTTWKGGLNYEPFESLRFRGAISRDIRAPTLFELFATESITRASTLDPFTNTSGIIPEGRGGNANLQPEIGKTKTLGVVYRPEWAPRFGVSVDYYDIRIAGAVGTQTTPQILADCLASNGAAAVCSLIERPFPLTNRTPANFLTKVRLVPLNLAFIETKGVDFDANYSFDLSTLVEGRVALRAVVNYVDSFKTQLTATSPVNEVSGCTCVSTGGALPKWKALVSANYTHEGFGWLVQARYIDKLRLGPQVYVPDHLPAYTYFDTTFKYDTKFSGVNTQFFFTVNNLFNKIYPIWTDPTATPGGGGPTLSSIYDVMLRYYTVGVRAQF